MEITIITKENLSKEAADKLLLYLTEIVDTNYNVLFSRVRDTLPVKDCSKEVCNIEE